MRPMKLMRPLRVKTDQPMLDGLTIDQVKDYLTKQGWEVSIKDTWVQARNYVAGCYYRGACYLKGGVLWAGMHGGFYAVLVRSEFNQQSEAVCVK